jgi:hypothetical protein
MAALGRRSIIPTDAPSRSFFRAGKSFVPIPSILVDLTGSRKKYALMIDVRPGVRAGTKTFTPLPGLMLAAYSRVCLFGGMLEPANDRNSTPAPRTTIDRQIERAQLRRISA